MDNYTSIQFHILPFSSKVNMKLPIFCIFLIIYLIGIALNSIVIAVICLYANLHTPMYLLFCNLSSIDICYTTVIIPNLLYILLSGDDLLSVTQCFTQMYFFIMSSSAEVMFLFVMGFDRYVAICHPLSYHRILSKKLCILIIFTIWSSAALNSALFLSLLRQLPFYGILSIENVFCETIDIFHAACGGFYEFNIAVYVEMVLLGLFPFLCNCFSYVNIIRVILHIKSEEGKRKTFSSCSSHLTVMIIYYSASFMVYVMPFSDHMVLMKQILSVFYNTVVPMINPLIYSLRNSEIIKACQKLLKMK